MLFVLCEKGTAERVDSALNDVNKKRPEPARMMKTAGNGWA